MKCLPTALILFPAYLADAQYSGCAIDAYYSRFNLNSYSRNNKGALRAFMGDLLYATHRGIIPNTNTTEAGVGDTWAALMDLDVGSSPEKIKLLYSLEEIASKPFGGSRGWVKELLHPISRGVGLQGPDVSDLHNLRPVTYLSDLVRADKYFGECGHLVPNDTCEEPAEGGADGTCSCNRVYTPPAEVKGDIARALMYMDLRYDGRDEDSINLRLTDCPFQHERDMAYLSQMLTWHKEDPVDDAEIERNNKVCEQYQGNRNPFVDFPSLADKLWDEPLPLPAKGEREIYEACEKIPTQSPTSDPNQCEFLSEGDIYIWLINSEDPDNLGLFTFEDLEEDFDLFMTTNPWNGTAFVEQGGTVAVSRRRRSIVCISII
jgi:endonuclease I